MNQWTQLTLTRREAPESLSANELLIAANEFLDIVRPGDLNPEVTDAARAMAYCAWSVAVFGGEQSRLKLKNATRTFFMLSGLAKAAEKLANN